MTYTRNSIQPPFGFVLGVADHPLFRVEFRMQGQDAQPLDLSPGNRVIVGPHQFIAPANGQHGVVIIDVFFQGLLEALQVLGTALFLTLQKNKKVAPEQLLADYTEKIIQGDYDGMYDMPAT